MRKAENVGLTTREPEKTFLEIRVTIRDSLSDIARSNDEEGGEYKVDEDIELGKLSEDDNPGWVMGTISKTVQLHIMRFQQKQMTLDELT